MMDFGILAQHLLNGLMLGVIYAMVAVGFSLFFGVLDVVNFSHGDVVTVGAFSMFGALTLGEWFHLPFALSVVLALVATIVVGCVFGIFIARTLILPMRFAPPVNVLLGTLMAGTVMHELIRLFVPNGGNPKPFPALVNEANYHFGSFSVGIDSILILAFGVFLVLGTHFLISRTRLGLAIRAVAQDSEIARLAGVNFQRTVLVTFAIGSVLATLAGCMLGFYYREINFNMGVLLGVIGFASAVIGGLGSLIGPILGGFLLAGVQTLAVMLLPFSSEYKDVIVFAGIIILLAIFPTGLLAERRSERV